MAPLAHTGSPVLTEASNNQHELPESELTESEVEGLRAQIDALGDWFHNIRIGPVSTAPNHFLGDYPRNKWERIAPAVPDNLAGQSVLDIGCNGGFYSFEMKRRGAGRVVGIDADERYLDQARFAADRLGYDIEFHQSSVYEVDKLAERFDVVLFMGLFYHLRYPLYALDKVVEHTSGVLVFQTMVRPTRKTAAGGRRRPIRTVAEDYDFWENSIFRRDDFPRMHFIEHSFAHDQTNWWIPNESGVEAILRSAGLEIFCHPEEETWFCAPTSTMRRGQSIHERELNGTLW